MARRVNWEMMMIDWIAFALVVIGAAVWGLVGLGNFVGVNLNLVQILLGWFQPLANIVYLAVGASGLYLLVRGLEEWTEG